MYVGHVGGRGHFECMVSGIMCRVVKIMWSVWCLGSCVGCLESH